MVASQLQETKKARVKGVACSRLLYGLQIREEHCAHADQGEKGAELLDVNDAG